MQSEKRIMVPLCSLGICGLYGDWNCRVSHEPGLRGFLLHTAPLPPPGTSDRFRILGVLQRAAMGLNPRPCNQSYFSRALRYYSYNGPTFVQQLWASAAYRKHEQWQRRKDTS